MQRVAHLVIALALVGLPAFAGSTGTTALHTPQGENAGLPFGDFVSDNDGGALNTFYRYFIEVPPGVARLTVEIFDADLGISASEDTAGRDRDRNGYDTTVTYSLRDPAGTVVPTVFTVGNTTGPVGADNAWLTFYDATGNSVRDNFGTASYANNDGNNSWTAVWSESDGGGGGATGGAIQVTGGELRIQDGVSGTPSIQREADLLGTPGLNLQVAFLTFDYRTSGTLEASDQVSVQVSANGGGSWTTLETFADDSSGSRSYDITSSIANNTRVRFLVGGGLTGDEFFFFDDLQITDGVKTAGHWELRIDQSAGGDDINALGIRAHDGTAGAGGTELNVYADSMWPLGVNPPGSGTTSRSYTIHPYITSGCTCGKNDFDFDSDSGNTGSMTFSSRTGSFSQSYSGAAMSQNNQWRRNAFSGWTSDGSARDYGIWTLDATIASYLSPGVNGNYATTYVSSFAAAANPPTANPVVNAFRTYLPNDAGSAPAKPFLEQVVTYNRNFLGPNPPAVGVTTTFTVTIAIVNPSAHAITFSAANLVRANVPGGAVVYGGNAQVGQGSVVSQPAIGGSGNITWNPSTLSAGATAILSYDVKVTPTSAGQRIPVTATPASGNGTRAQYVDETGNTTQARATYLQGPLCELAVTEGSLLTDVLLSSFRAERGVVEWTTASEAGTIGFNVLRADGSKVNHSLIPASRTGRYELFDAFGSDGYVIEEITAQGKTNRHGPLHAHAPLGTSRRAVEWRPASSPRPQSRLHAEAAPRSLAAKPAALMAGVTSTGIVRISASDLAAHLGRPLGSIESAIRRGDVSVTDDGAAVAWTAAGGGILFFGQASASIYANERVYRVELARGTTMNTVGAGPAGGPLSTFTAAQNVERDVFPATVLPLDPESDYWFWDFLVSGDATYGRKTFAVDAPFIASASGASLEIRLQGAIAGAAHQARVTLNGVPLGAVAWSSLDGHTATLAVPPGVLAATNEVAVEGLLAPGEPFDVFYVDGFTLRYQRFATAAGSLEISRGGTIVAQGFGSAPVVLDVTNRRKPALLTGAAFAGGTVSFAAPQSTRSVFLADAFLTPSIRAIGEPVLKKRVHADYVIVAPAALRDGAEALARLRQGAGLQTYVADLEQIYDEFGGGNRTPHAIRTFLTSVSPRYAVLAGTGTYDYRGLDVGPGLVPPLMTRTEWGLFASDVLFAPKTAIGRIPVTSAAELLAYVDKLASNRAAGNAPMVFATDAVDRGADFRRASTAAAAPLTDRPMTRVDLDLVPPGDARASLLASWQQGMPLLSWTGHGGLDQLSSAGILTAADAPSLVSDGPLPLFVAMTCTINRFEDGIVEPLGAALTRAAGAGALAVWSASGLSEHGDATELQRTFFRLAAQNPGARVGDVIVQTLAAHPTQTAGIYVLLGDPALSLSFPSELSNEGPATRTGE